ncbi:hypothetical protein JCM11251_004348 [Rhodosporidiobolus azoricus]
MPAAKDVDFTPLTIATNTTPAASSKAGVAPRPYTFLPAHVFKVDLDNIDDPELLDFGNDVLGSGVDIFTYSQSPSRTVLVYDVHSGSGVPSSTSRKLHNLAFQTRLIKTLGPNAMWLASPLTTDTPKTGNIRVSLQRKVEKGADVKCWHSAKATNEASVKGWWFPCATQEAPPKWLEWTEPAMGQLLYDFIRFDPPRIQDVPAMPLAQLRLYPALNERMYRLEADLAASPVPVAFPQTSEVNRLFASSATEANSPSAANPSSPTLRRFEVPRPTSSPIPSATEGTNTVPIRVTFIADRGVVRVRSADIFRFIFEDKGRVADTLYNRKDRQAHNESDVCGRLLWRTNEINTLEIHDVKQQTAQVGNSKPGNAAAQERWVRNAPASDNGFYAFQAGAPPMFTPVRSLDILTNSKNAKKNIRTFLEMFEGFLTSMSWSMDPALEEHIKSLKISPEATLDTARTSRFKPIDDIVQSIWEDKPREDVRRQKEAPKVQIVIERARATFLNSGNEYTGKSIHFTHPFTSAGLNLAGQAEDCLGRQRCSAAAGVPSSSPIASQTTSSDAALSSRIQATVLPCWTVRTIHSHIHLWPLTNTLAMATVWDHFQVLWVLPPNVHVPYATRPRSIYSNKEIEISTSSATPRGGPFALVSTLEGAEKAIWILADHTRSALPFSPALGCLRDAVYEQKDLDIVVEDARLTALTMSFAPLLFEPSKDDILAISVLQNSVLSAGELAEMATSADHLSAYGDGGFAGLIYSVLRHHVYTQSIIEHRSFPVDANLERGTILRLRSHLVTPELCGTLPNPLSGDQQPVFITGPRYSWEKCTVDNFGIFKSGLPALLADLEAAAARLDIAVRLLGTGPPDMYFHILDGLSAADFPPTPLNPPHVINEAFGAPMLDLLSLIAQHNGRTIDGAEIVIVFGGWDGGPISARQFADAFKHWDAGVAVWCYGEHVAYGVGSVLVSPTSARQWRATAVSIPKFTWWCQMRVLQGLQGAQARLAAHIATAPVILPVEVTIYDRILYIWTLEMYKRLDKERNAIGA